MHIGGVCLTVRMFYICRYQAPTCMSVVDGLFWENRSYSGGQEIPCILLPCSRRRAIHLLSHFKLDHFVTLYCKDRFNIIIQ